MRRWIHRLQGERAQGCAVRQRQGGAPRAGASIHSLVQPSAGSPPSDRCVSARVVYVLRTGVPLAVAAAQFGVSEASASMICTTWWIYLHRELERENPWPTKEEIQRTMPNNFKQQRRARATRTVIDCTELEVQAPNNPFIRKLFWCAPPP